MQEFGPAQAKQHPRTILNYEFCFIGGIHGYNFSSGECRRVHGHPLKGVCFLFVGEPSFPEVNVRAFLSQHSLVVTNVIGAKAMNRYAIPSLKARVE